MSPSSIRSLIHFRNFKSHFTCESQQPTTINMACLALTTFLTSALTLSHFTLGTRATSELPDDDELCGRGLPTIPFNRTALTTIGPYSYDPPAWSPWTHRPYCLEANEEPWCVYTNAASPKGHGISIITTPEIAGSALNILEHPFDQKFFAPEKLYLPRPYKVVDIPGKGKGAIATQKIEKGKAILVDHASIIAAAEYPSDVMREEVQDLLATAVHRLGNPEKVLGLSRKGREGEDEGATEIEDLLLTNSFTVGIQGKEFIALFADLSRLNHDCKPNAFIYFSETTLAMTVWASRDIEPGEEISITYSAAGLLSTERTQTLQNIWGFKWSVPLCFPSNSTTNLLTSHSQCALCTASPEVLKKSDDNRAQIRSYQASIPKLANEEKFHEALQQAEHMFKLVEEEGLTDQMSDMYEYPARLYYQVGNLDKALEYTLKVKREIDGFGVPGKFGQEKLEAMEGIIKRLEMEIKIKKEREAQFGNMNLKGKYGRRMVMGMP
ncbi:hypothetical protein QBC41DRAFT_17815 [Cercophora samala]|uniref:SET domain-containing protein n=1 Tax=Cercophora samala TaxID=330535 RepID=A0AA40D6E9_9PEZI|nr:hypothetical protein QBC41DRAFT_17815 [Cercophora samala]